MARKTLLIGAGALILAGGVALVVATAALDPQRLQNDLKDAVLHATGRELAMGAVHLRMGLSPSLEVDDVALANIAGGSRPQMLTAKRLTARLALLPLLGGDAVISSLSLDDADILLERAPDGTANWQFSPARRALYRQSETQASNEGGAGGGGHRIQIRALSLQGGRIAWHGRLDASLAIDTLTWTADSPDAPMRLAAELASNGTPIKVSANAGSLQRLQGGATSALAGAWPLTVDANGAGATLHVEGGINHPDQGRGYEFRLTANAPKLEALDALWARANLPPMQDVNVTAVLQDGSAGQLRTSQVSIHAGQSDLGHWVPGLAVRQADLSAPGPGQLANMVVDGTYQDQPLRLAGTAMQPDVVDRTAPLQVTLTAQAAGATASARGTVPPGADAAGLDLTLNAKAPDLSTLAPLFGHALPAAHDFSLAAQLSDAGVKLRGIAVRDLTIGSSLGDLSGQLTVEWSPRGTVTGSLTSQVLNLDAIGGGDVGLLPTIWPAPASDGGQMQAIAPPAPPPTPAPPATPAPQVASTDATTGGLPLAQLRRNDADLALNIGDLTVEGQHVEDLQAHLQLHDGKLALNPFRAQTPQGAVVGGFSIDASTDEPPVALTLRSPSISADAVAGLLGYPGGAQGTMQVDAQLSGTGQTVDAVKATLNGHLGVAMVGGQVQDAMVQGLIGDALNAAGTPVFSGGTSQVRCFAARLDFDRGVGRVRVLATDTSKLTLDGSGQIDLATRTLDLHLRPRVRLGPTEIAAPVSLRGPIGGVKASLDPVLGGGRVGLSIGGAPSGPSGCVSGLAVARAGLGGPLPAAAPAANPGFVIRKPKDLLKDLFH